MLSFYSIQRLVYSCFLRTRVQTLCRLYNIFTFLACCTPNLLSGFCAFATGSRILLLLLLLTSPADIATIISIDDTATTSIAFVKLLFPFFLLVVVIAIH